MRTGILFILIAISFISAEAQSLTKNAASVDSIKPVQHEFKNQGEQEGYWAEEFFKNQYKKKIFERFKGRLIINNQTYKYDDQILNVFYTKPELKGIFEKGIFYPKLFSEATGFFIPDSNVRIRVIKSKPENKNKQESDSIKRQQEKLFYNLTRTDSLTITNLEEIKFLGTTPQRRRFRFLLERPGWLNPTVCFIELTNEKAISSTDMITFIDGSTLTFFKEGWIQI